MQKAILLSISLTISIVAVAGVALADDWPQWRGPNRDGKSAETGLLKTWPPGGPKLLWSANIGGVGYSAPSVAEGKIFVMGNGEKEGIAKEWTVCLDEETGKQIWASKTGAIRSGGGGYPGPRSTPTFADGKVYAMGLGGRLVCCDAETGKPVWFRDMTLNLGGKAPHWGYSESVLVDGDRVICMPGTKNAVVALDAKTGDTTWATEAEDPASYSSVIKATLADTPQYIAFTGQGLLGVGVDDGAVLWRYDGPSNGQANCPTPVTLGSTVFAASGYGKGGGCAWIRKDYEGNFSATPLYFTNKMQNQHGGFVLVDGFLYGCADPGVLVCLNYKTGVVIRAIRMGRFSIAYADGMLYLRNERGFMNLYEASSKNLTRRGAFVQPQRSEKKTWTHPVIANGRLYLRDQYILLCYDIAEEPPIAEEKQGPAPPTGAAVEDPAAATPQDPPAAPGN